VFGVDKVTITIRQNSTSVFCHWGHLWSSYKVTDLWYSYSNIFWLKL